MLNIGAADIVHGHMVVHDLGAGSERVGKPPVLGRTCEDAPRQIPSDSYYMPAMLAGGTLRALLTLLPFSFLPSRLLASA